MALTPEQFLKQTANYLVELQKAKKLVGKVGLPKEKVGGKAYGNGISVIAVGAVHEFGGTWTHPGGTPYGFKTKKDASEGKFQFLKKGEGFLVIGVTKAHKITMPQRSFLRLPFLLKFKEIDEALGKQFQKIPEGKTTAEKGLGLVMLRAVNISKKAFTTQGFGKWRKSKKKKGQTLIVTALLRNSITFFVGNK